MANTQITLFNIDVFPCDATVAAVGYLYKAFAISAVIPVIRVTPTVENVYDVKAEDTPVILIKTTTELVPVKPRIFVKSETKNVVDVAGRTQLAVTVTPKTQAVVFARGIVRKMAISQ